MQNYIRYWNLRRIIILHFHAQSIVPHIVEEFNRGFKIQIATHTNFCCRWEKKGLPLCIWAVWASCMYCLGLSYYVNAEQAFLIGFWLSQAYEVILNSDVKYRGLAVIKRDEEPKESKSERRQIWWQLFHHSFFE